MRLLYLALALVSVGAHAQTTAPVPPVITTPLEAGLATAKAPRRTNLHMGRALDAYVLEGDAITITDVRVDKARYGMTMRRKDGTYGTATNLTISRIDLSAYESPIYIRGGSNGILIEDARLVCTHTGSGIPGGVKIGSANTAPNYNITIHRTTVTGCVGAQGTYVQGDGIATERPDHHITISDTVSTDHGDGCMDLKSSDTRLDNVMVARCNYGLRFWAQGTAGTVTIGEVSKAAIQIKPTTDWTIDNLILTAPALAADIVTDGAGGKLTIARCSRPVTLRIAAGTTLVLGPGCS